MAWEIILILADKEVTYNQISLRRRRKRELRKLVVH